MTNIKHTLTILALTLNFGLHAGWPGTASFLMKDASSATIYKNTNSNFIREKKNRVITLPAFTLNQEIRINAGYITGQPKKTVSALTRMLHWDFKVKFRLNRNMNIIFSYN